jgi:hypothetical protein
MPVVLTNTVTQSNYVVTVAGDVTADNGSVVTERGFVYSTTTAPTISNTKIISDAGTGAFSGSTPTLDANTYYFRTFATNGIGTSYGVEETITESSLSVDDVESIPELGVYPNPAMTSIYIKGLQQATAYRIYNVLGMQVKRGTVAIGAAIEIANFKNGVYVCRFEDGGVFKFAKNNGVLGSLEN